MDNRKIVFKAELDAEGVEEGLEDIERASTKTTGSMQSGFDAVNDLMGGIPSKIADVISGIGGMVKGMTTLKGAIIGTGIGALIVVLGSLTAAFTTSEAGQDKFAKILKITGAVIGNLTDVLSALGDKIIWAFENPKEAITNFANLIKENITNRIEGIVELIPALGNAISLVFQGKFGEAGKVAADAAGKVALGVEGITDKVEEAGKAIGEFADEVEKDMEKAARVADKLDKADDIARELLVQRQRVEAEIAEARLNARETENLSVEERIAMLQNAQKMEDGLFDKEQRMLTLRRDAIKMENSLNRTSEEGVDKLAQAEADLEALRVKRLQSQRLIQRETIRLNKEAKREAEEARKADEDAAKAAEERLKALIAANQAYYSERERQEQNLSNIFQTREQNELDAVARKYDEMALYAEQHGITMAELSAKQEEELAAISQRYRDEEKKKADEDAAKATAREQQKFAQKINFAGQALGAISQLNAAFTRNDEKDSKKAFKRNKAINLATAIVQTGQAVTAALTAGGNPLKLATGAQFVEAGIAAAVGAAQIATIAKTEYTSTNAPSAPSVTPPTITSGGAQNTTPNIDPGAFGGGWSMGAQRTYVVSKEVTNAQSANQLVTDQATLL
jgi:hypothetical protein